MDLSLFEPYAAKAHHEDRLTFWLPTVATARSGVSRHYLLFKLQQAQKGRVPLGPRESRRKEGESFNRLLKKLALALAPTTRYYIIRATR